MRCGHAICASACPVVTSGRRRSRLDASWSTTPPAQQRARRCQILPMRLSPNQPERDASTCSRHCPFSTRGGRMRREGAPHLEADIGKDDQDHQADSALDPLVGRRRPRRSAAAAMNQTRIAPIARLIAISSHRVSFAPAAFDHEHHKQRNVSQHESQHHGRARRPGSRSRTSAPLRGGDSTRCRSPTAAG